MTSYAAHLQEHLRLTLLQLLEGQPQYQSNDGVLTDAARATGLPVTRDQVKTELFWLAEQGLAETRQMGLILLASATERGADVALGRSRVAGVRRPGP